MSLRFSASIFCRFVSLTPLLPLVGAVTLSGCASLYQVQIGEIDNTHAKSSRVEVKGSETGIDIKEAASIAKSLSRSRAVTRASDTASTLWDLISYGPQTGKVTFSDDYADGLQRRLIEACPSRRITGLMSIREANHYPVVSGEIVRLVGYCIEDPSAASAASRKGVL